MKTRQKQEEKQEEKEVLNIEEIYNVLIWEFLAIRKAGGR